uniref:Secreted protein n=1 Tax=Ascaris lumbricoides TaxID=6252 RepID=A0A0M3I1R1_ASCLU
MQYERIILWIQISLQIINASADESHSKENDGSIGFAHQKYCLLLSSTLEFSTFVLDCTKDRSCYKVIKKFTELKITQVRCRRNEGDTLQFISITALSLAANFSAVHVSCLLLLR